MAPIKVLLLRDDRPGHFNQSEGIVAALKRRMNVEIEYLDIIKKPLVPARVFRWLITRSRLPISLIVLLSGLTSAQIQHLLTKKIDLIVSTGGKTLAHNVLLTRSSGASNIYSGSLRGVSSQYFSAVLHINPELEKKPKYIVGLKPSTVQPTLRPQRSRHNRRYCLLVGGPTRYQPSHTEDWQVLLQSIANSSQGWTIVTSRRTPGDVIELLTETVLNNENLTLKNFLDTGSGVAASVIEESDGVVVTEDSTSMVSEGIAAGLPVVSLTVEGGKVSSDASYIDLMRSRNWYRPIDLSSATEDIILSELEQCTPSSESHLDILADRLLAQIPELHKFVR